jgi:hypothetical protein
MKMRHLHEKNVEEDQCPHLQRGGTIHWAKAQYCHNDAFEMLRHCK